VVNRAFASRYLPGGSLGRRVRLGDARSGSPWMTVVGVAGDVRHSELTRAPRPEIYLPLAQTTPAMMMLAVRTTGEPLDLAPPVRREVLAVDPRQPVFHVKAMTELIDSALLAHTASAALVAVFGGIALVLAVIGVYGVVSYGVTQQMPEFGLRLALGSTPAALVRQVIARGLRLLGAGVVLGAGGAAALSGGLASLLYGVEPLDPLTYAAVGCGIAALGLVATAIPAARAATAEPVSALRAD
jgi:putative ABC transport system permease protein